MGWFTRSKSDESTKRDDPQAKSPPSLEQMRARVSSGDLSYLMSLPAGYEGQATALFMEAGLAGAFMGDDEASRRKFVEALEITRREGHRPAEARVLYNLGLAQYKLGDLDGATRTLLEGKALSESITTDLGREARKLQRFAEERAVDAPAVDVFGAPDLEQQLLEMYVKALAVVYDAAGRHAEAAECNAELERLYQKGG
jgi:tetratricopeptide (TPR) repeat protein